MLGDMQHSTKLILFVTLLGLFTTEAIRNVTKSETNPGARAHKALGIFSVIQFPNSACAGTSGLNGTCYTTEECDAKGGTSAGTCASSFGVCCIFSLACGSTSTENSTYLTITSYNVNTDDSPCTYTICPSSTDVCKLKIDFEAFSISGPFTVPIVTTLNGGADNKVGDCVTDALSITNPGGVAPPVICGLNTGQHIYVDAASDCNILNFNIDKTSSATRAWNLRVTQLACSSETTDHSCLQYLTGTSGTFSSFNFDTTATAVAASSTLHHLSDQDYNICFRREEGYCAVCFDPAITTAPGSFGVSSSKDGAAGQSANEISCDTLAATVYADYISVDGLHNPADVISSSLVNTAAIAMAEKVCGQIFEATEAKTASATLCSYRIPFKWGVHFDGGEVLGADGTAGANQNTLENNLGSVGFFMNYWQVAC